MVVCWCVCVWLKGKCLINNNLFFFLPYLCAVVISIACSYPPSHHGHYPTIWTTMVGVFSLSLLLSLFYQLLFRMNVLNLFQKKKKTEYNFNNDTYTHTPTLICSHLLRTPLKMDLYCLIRLEVLFTIKLIELSLIFITAHSIRLVYIRFVPVYLDRERFPGELGVGGFD